MKIGKAGLKLIKEFEGYHKELPDGRCQAYYDKSGKVWTIGWGCTEGVKKGDIWTRNQAEKALKREINKHESIVRNLVKVPLNQNQFDALVSLSYNTGLGADTQTILKRLNAGDYAGAANAFKLYNKSGGKIISGLVRRREDEKNLFLKPVKEEIVASSRLLRWMKNIRLFIGTTVAGWFTADTLGIAQSWMTDLKDFMTNPWFWAVLGSVAGFWFFIKFIEFMTIRAAEEGRYTPSRLAK